MLGAHAAGQLWEPSDWRRCCRRELILHSSIVPASNPPHNLLRMDLTGTVQKSGDGDPHRTRLPQSSLSSARWPGMGCVQQARPNFQGSKMRPCVPDTLESPTSSCLQSFKWESRIWVRDKKCLLCYVSFPRLQGFARTAAQALPLTAIFASLASRNRSRAQNSWQAQREEVDHLASCKCHKNPACPPSLRQATA